MKQYYECHITFLAPKQDGKRVEEITGWKFSQIDGDPVLGDGLKSYLTKHYNSKVSTDDIISFMQNTADVLIRSTDYEVIRKKIELVVYDTKVVYGGYKKGQWIKSHGLPIEDYVGQISSNKDGSIYIERLTFNQKNGIYMLRPTALVFLSEPNMYMGGPYAKDHLTIINENEAFEFAKNNPGELYD